MNKTINGIKYYAAQVSDGYQLWLSKTHPNYKHWTKIKNK